MCHTSLVRWLLWLGTNRCQDEFVLYERGARETEKACVRMSGVDVGSERRKRRTRERKREGETEREKPKAVFTSA